MRMSHSLVLCAAVAFMSVGCEHEGERDHVVVQGQASVDVPQGAVVDGPGVVAVDVEPDPAQRVYVYDDGYPPGTYLYDNYYYYGGYRYPRDVFVNRYVQDNIRQHHFANRDENHRQGQQIEQRQRADFTRTHGIRQNGAARPAEQAPIRHQEAPHANIEQRQENRPAVKEEHHPAVQQPENRTPAREENRINGERPANPTPAKEQRPENKTKLENEQRKANTAEPRKEESRKEELKKEEPRKEEPK